MSSDVWVDYYDYKDYPPIRKFTHPISQPDTIHSFLNQERIWVDHEGREHKIKDMSKEYIWNVLSWLNSNAERISFAYNFSGPVGDPLEQPLVKKLEKRYLKLSGI